MRWLGREVIGGIGTGWGNAKHHPKHDSKKCGSFGGLRSTTFSQNKLNHFSYWWIHRVAYSGLLWCVMRQNDFDLSNDREGGAGRRGAPERNVACEPGRGPGSTAEREGGGRPPPRGWLNQGVGECNVPYNPSVDRGANRNTERSPPPLLPPLHPASSPLAHRPFLALKGATPLANRSHLYSLGTPTGFE